MRKRESKKKRSGISEGRAWEERRRRRKKKKNKKKSRDENRDPRIETNMALKKRSEGDKERTV